MEQITSEMLKGIFQLSKNINRYLGALNDAMQKCDINTKNRIRAFLAQVGHESAQLNCIEENLNYSASALVAVFPKYFRTVQDAAPYARRPERIANKVYAGRMGNGGEESGDGWKFRGRGLIQITGRGNYVSMSKLMGKDLTVYPESLLMPIDACLSAALWWRENGLNGMADNLGHGDDIAVMKAMTKRINGGLNGLDDRIEIYNRAKSVIV